MGLLDFFRRRPPEPRAIDALTEGLRAKAGTVANIEARFATSFTSWLMSTRGDQERLEAYGEDPWLTPTVSRRAEAVAKVEWRLYRTRDAEQRARSLRFAEHETRSEAISSMLIAGILEEVADHEVLELLAQPMPTMTGFEFWELASVYLDILGEDLFVKERAGGKVPRWLNIVPPPNIKTRPDVGEMFFEIATRKGNDRVGVLDAIWTRRVNPANIFTGRGIGLGRALRDELATDQAMSSTARALYKNRGSPDLMIGLESGTPGMGPPGPDVVKQFALDLKNKHEGPEKAGGVHVFGGKFTAQKLAGTLVESQYIQGREFNRNTTMQGFGSPPEIHGVLDNANRSTIDAALTHFALLSTVPTLDRFCAALQAGLLPEFGGRFVLGFTNPVPADKDFKKATMVAMPSAFEIDEARAVAGYAPLANKAGKVLMKGSNVPAPDAPKNIPGKDPATTKKKPEEDPDADA